jgi:hypothetical protein
MLEAMMKAMVMKMTQEIAWQELYRTAMLELDTTKLHQGIEAAIAAVSLRMEELAKGDGSFMEEGQALTDALQNLRTLQRVESRASIKPTVVSSEPQYEGGI